MIDIREVSRPMTGISELGRLVTGFSEVSNDDSANENNKIDECSVGDCTVAKYKHMVLSKTTYA